MIEWRKPDRAGAGYDGYIGRVRVFSLNWGVYRQRELPWVLRCTLPGYESKEWPCADQDEANDRAMRIWRRWLSAVGLDQGSDDDA